MSPLPEELASALADAAALARREGRFTLAEDLESRLVPGPAFRLELLGSRPRLFLDRPGEAPLEVAWRLRRAFATLAILALERDWSTPREVLIETIWSEESAEAIRRNFHPVLSDLRRTLQDTLALVGQAEAEVLVFHLGLYRLEPQLPLEVDVQVFEQRVAEAEKCRRRGDDDAALLHLRAAWQLYQGPLLEGFEGERLQRRREHLHRAYLGMLRRVGDMAAARGEGELATDAFRSLLFEEPFDESVHLELMRLYARADRRDLVRRQFVRLQENLKELDVEPLRATQEEFHRLMR